MLAAPSVKPQADETFRAAFLGPDDVERLLEDPSPESRISVLQ